MLKATIGSVIKEIVDWMAPTSNSAPRRSRPRVGRYAGNRGKFGQWLPRRPVVTLDTLEAARGQRQFCRRVGAASRPAVDAQSLREELGRRWPVAEAGGGQWRKGRQASDRSADTRPRRACVNQRRRRQHCAAAAAAAATESAAALGVSCAKNGSG